MSSVLSIRDVSKQYSSVQALNRVAFDVGVGRIVGLLGQNGAGKSTLIRCILGLLQYQGQISIFGHDVREYRELLMQDVAFIADVALLPSWMTVLELLQLTADLHPNFDFQLALDMLQFEEVTVTSVFSELSKGNKTIVHLVIVLSIKAKLLVLDEPFLGLDINRRRRFLERLSLFVEDGNRSVLISSHQLEEIDHVLTDIVMIEKGHCLFAGDVRSIKDRYTTLVVPRDQIEVMAALPEPVLKYDQLDRSVCLFDGLGDRVVPDVCQVVPTSLSDVFVLHVDDKPRVGG